MRRASWAAAALVGAASLAVPATLGYDAWAWTVWGRELAHLDLATTGGPSFKPLPVLVLAPLSLLGDATPFVWMALMRASAVVAVLLAYRVGARLAGPLAGVGAAVSLALSTDLYRTALLGSSEPALVALGLAAVECHLTGRRRAVLACLAGMGLIRPEAWLLAGAYGLYVWRAERWFAAGAVAIAPVLWLGLDWAGSGEPLHGGNTATDAAAGSAATAAVPALEVLRRGADTVLLPTLVLAGVGLVLAWRRRSRPVLGLAVLALAWIAVVAVMAEGGFSGTRRYLVVPAAAMCVVAGAGLAWLADRRERLMVIGLVCLLAALPAARRAREDARLASVARSQADQLSELRDAVDRAGGPAAVLGVGRPAINPWLQTALAWELDVPLTHVQATWASSRAQPHWAPPALVFRAPARLAGPRPVLPRGASAAVVARAGRWRVLRAA